MNLANGNHILFCVIMDYGEGSKVLKVSKELGVSGGTFFLGKGTAKSSLLDALGLNEIRKEILIMVVEENLESIIFNELNKKFSLNKANHGIAFSMPLSNLIGIKESKYISSSKKRGVDNMEYEAIFTIVDKGLSEDVIEAAKSVGSTGGTVIHGRGSGTSEHKRLFNIEIEPEKDIILILSPVEDTEVVVNSIREKLDIDKLGKGIIFVLDVSRAMGLFNN